MPNCYFCNKQVNLDDVCFGCNHYVCQDCDKSGPFGEHSVEEHLKDEDDE